MIAAFYAPLKSPNHPVPSGDRSMARALVKALELAGCTVTLASDLRLYEGAGDPALQADLTRQAEAEAARLIALPAAQHWRLWLTYHNYYKAPDLIGPLVTRQLGIPYLQIESTRAKKRLTGPWSAFAAAAEAASDAAHAILYLTQRDAEALHRDAPPGQHLVHLPPFLDRTDLPPTSDLSGDILSVGMMRTGDKAASYRLIADALARVPPQIDWRLTVVGDGPAADAIRAEFAPHQGRVTWLGRRTPDALAQIYGQARALLWPGVNEAFGMTYLEAQAAGVPVIAQDRPGVRDVLAHTGSNPASGPHALAQRIAALWQDTACAEAEGRAARDFIAARHLLPHAAHTLSRTIAALT